MTDGDSLPGSRRVNYAAWSFALAFLTLGGGIVAQWAAGAERARQSEARDIEQNAEIAKLRAQVRDIENNRALEVKIGELTVALARVETEVRAMRVDVRGRR